MTENGIEKLAYIVLDISRLPKGEIIGEHLGELKQFIETYAKEQAETYGKYTYVQLKARMLRLSYGEWLKQSNGKA